MNFDMAHLMSVQFVPCRGNDNFSSKLHEPYVIGKLSISGAGICYFGKIESKNKKIHLLKGYFLTQLTEQV